MWGYLSTYLSNFDGADFLKNFAPVLAATFFGALFAIPAGLFVNGRFENRQALHQIRATKTILLRELDRSLANLNVQESSYLDKLIGMETGFLTAFIHNPRYVSAAPNSLIAALFEYQAVLTDLKGMRRLHAQALISQDTRTLSAVMPVFNKYTDQLGRKVIHVANDLRLELEQWTP